MSDYQPEPPPRPAPADRVVANARVLFAGLERSQHFIGSHRYAIDGDRATITAHMRAGALAAYRTGVRPLHDVWYLYR